MGEESVQKMTEIPSTTTKEEITTIDTTAATTIAAAKAHVVLIHGVSHGAWCWYKVRTLLESWGHMVTALDLKASGTDPSTVDNLSSFDDYNHPLLLYLSSLPPLHKVILVGHSAGGINVTDAVHKFPDKIKGAIYIGATMLQFGFLSHQDLLDGAPDLSDYGEAYDINFGLGMDQPPTSAIIKKELQRKILYQMSPLEDSTLASMLLRPFPLLITKVIFTQGKESDSEKVARVYIKTLQDRVVKPEQQEVMIKRWPPSVVYTIDSDHCPFFSNPFVLSSLLSKVASSF